MVTAITVMAATSAGVQARRAATHAIHLAQALQPPRGVPTAHPHVQADVVVHVAAVAPAHAVAVVVRGARVRAVAVARLVARGRLHHPGAPLAQIPVAAVARQIVRRIVATTARKVVVPDAIMGAVKAVRVHVVLHV